MQVRGKVDLPTDVLERAHPAYSNPESWNTYARCSGLLMDLSYMTGLSDRQLSAVLGAHSTFQHLLPGRSPFSPQVLNMVRHRKVLFALRSNGDYGGEFMIGVKSAEVLVKVATEVRRELGEALVDAALVGPAEFNLYVEDGEEEVRQMLLLP